MLGDAQANNIPLRTFLPEPTDDIGGFNLFGIHTYEFIDGSRVSVFEDIHYYLEEFSKVFELRTEQCLSKVLGANTPISIVEHFNNLITLDKGIEIIPVDVISEIHKYDVNTQSFIDRFDFLPEVSSESFHFFRPTTMSLGRLFQTSQSSTPRIITEYLGNTVKYNRVGTLPVRNGRV
jgi:hypothetical protein